MLDAEEVLRFTDSAKFVTEDGYEFESPECAYLYRVVVQHKGGARAELVLEREGSDALGEPSWFPVADFSNAEDWLWLILAAIQCQEPKPTPQAEPGDAEA